jgi:hypothetical protein
MGRLPRRVPGASLLLALLLAAVAVGYRHQQETGRSRHTRFDLPGYDAHVYVAMAEHPAFFTVAPWGYRALTPWVVHVFPAPKVIRGFRLVNLAALTLASAVLCLFLRRLGSAWWAALAGMTAFSLSGPTAEVLRYGFLADPLTVLLFISFLLAVESGASLPILCLLMALGSFSKELFLVLLPLVFLEALPRVGPVRSLLRAGAVTLVAVLVTWLLRGWWAPQTAASGGSGLGDLPGAVASIVTSSRRWIRPLLLGGILPLGLVGALRRVSRPYLARYGYLLLAMTALPFAAGVYTGESQVAHFFAGDVGRLLIYALPLWIPLALLALAPWTRKTPPPPPHPGRAVAGLATAASLLFLIWIPLALDRYHRLDLRGSRDGPLVLGLVRESLRTASRLDRGRAVTFTPASHRYSWGLSDPGQLGLLRWFLREGWGTLPHYGLDDIVMEGKTARLLLPCLTPRDLELVLALGASERQRLRVLVNGRAVGSAEAGPEPVESVLSVPGGLLFRGDNQVTLIRADGAGPVLLLKLGYRPTAGPG